MDNIRKQNGINSIGNVIFKSRKQKGLTQEELGKLINVDKSTISSYERNRTVPDQEIMKRLSNVLDISEQDLFSQKETDKNRTDLVAQDSLLYELYKVLKKRERQDQKILVEFMKRFL